MKLEPDPPSSSNPTSEVLKEIAQAAAQIRNEHEQETTILQRGVDRLTAVVGWPGFVAALAVSIGLWVVINQFHVQLGIKRLDTPYFAWLQVVLAAGAAFVAVLIFTTQRHAGYLASHRSQLTLELVILIDRKISKVIGLIEEQRRDSPVIADRVDGEANILATPSDTNAVLKAIKEDPGPPA